MLSFFFFSLKLLPEIGNKDVFEVKIKESEKAGNYWELCSQCSATELRQPDNHQPSILRGTSVPPVQYKGL